MKPGPALVAAISLACGLAISAATVVASQANQPSSVLALEAIHYIAPGQPLNKLDTSLVRISAPSALLSQLAKPDLIRGHKPAQVALQPGAIIVGADVAGGLGSTSLVALQLHSSPTLAGGDLIDVLANISQVPGQASEVAVFASGVNVESVSGSTITVRVPTREESAFAYASEYLQLTATVVDGSSGSSSVPEVASTAQALQLAHR